jgi:hypothetical protein
MYSSDFFLASPLDGVSGQTVKENHSPPCLEPFKLPQKIAAYIMKLLKAKKPS